MLKIASFNLRNLFDEGPRIDYKKEITITKEQTDAVVSELAKTISTFTPDILIAQEVGSPRLFNNIAEIVGGRYETFVATPDTRGIANGVFFNTNGEAQSLSDITSLPVLKEGGVDALSGAMLPYRNFVYLKTSYQDKPLMIIGVHIKTTLGIPLRAHDDSKKEVMSQHDAGEAIARALYYRSAQALRLRELIDAEFAIDQHAQIIVLGDFNAPENTELMRIIQGDRRFPDTQLANLSETIEKERRYSFAGYKEKRQIDHILISPNLAKNILKFEILNDNLEDQTIFPDIVYTASDHAPLVLTLK